MSVYVLGIDLGSSGTKAVVLDSDGGVRGYAYRPLARHYPRPGWVEQDPQAVAQGGREVVAEALARAGLHARQVTACGIAGQRNTAFAWDAETGAALANAITWQDLRTRDLLAEAAEWPHYAEARRRLGYPPGHYMAALHLAWRTRADHSVTAAAAAGRLRLGLSPAWLLASLGRPAAHVMDASLVQAQGLYDFRARTYWADWLAWLGVPVAALPHVVPTVHDFGALLVDNGSSVDEIPVRAMIGDQQAALFGSNGRRTGVAECTHGTASYVKAYLGDTAPELERLNVYCAWDLGAGQQYCLEAATSVTGAAMRWMREQAGLFASDQELSEAAAQVPDAGGLVFVPAFSGLEVPYLEPEARGTLLGLTLGHNRGHIARAFFEAIAYQMRMILETMHADAGLEVAELLVSGGVSASDLACQIQADLLGIPILRPSFRDTTAWAAGLLAGLGAGVWSSPAGLPELPGGKQRFEPALPASVREAGYRRWLEAVDLVRRWARTTEA